LCVSDASYEHIASVGYWKARRGEILKRLKLKVILKNAPYFPIKSQNNIPFHQFKFLLGLRYGILASKL